MTKRTQRRFRPQATTPKLSARDFEKVLKEELRVGQEQAFQRGVEISRRAVSALESCNQQLLEVTGALLSLRTSIRPGRETEGSPPATGHDRPS
ncbi:MAG TPA: hypothetical protein VEK07_25120 [Polyangiaceae bacterium]|nr:hypothetical protein [Polyangiaceae bacterium]